MWLRDTFSLFTIILLSSLQSLGQYGFQKVYDDSKLDTFSIISDFYVQDGKAYYTLGSGNTINRSELRLGTIDYQGDMEELLVHEDQSSLQRAFFSNVDTDTNFRGNLVNLYSNSSATGKNFRLIEYSLDGQVYFDSIYSDFWTVDSLHIFDYSKLVHLQDSSYLLNVNYVDKKESSTTYNIAGTMLLKINYDGEIDWLEKIFNTSHPDLPFSVGRNLIKENESIFIIHYMEMSNFSSSNANLSWARQKFLTIDIDGNILEEKQFQDGQYCYSYYGSYFDEDTTYLQYYDSKLFGSPPNNDYYKYMPVLSRIDENMDTVWRIQLGDFWHTGVSNYSSIQKIRKINDTTFISAYEHTEEIEYNLHYKNTVRILNFSSKGIINWKRDYFYYEIDLFNDPEYAVKDLEIMPDGGFIMGGQVFNYDFFNDSEPSQFAYVLRANCLGFINPPEAALSYENDGNEVLFINNSLSAGSYTYYFGDGDSLNTGENIDSLVHTYESGGDYEVTLIAQGCNGEADTVKLQLNIEEDEDSGSVGNGVFSIYPNPALQGELFTVETGNIEYSTLYFYDMNGKYLKKVPLPDAKTMYFIEHNFASGVYIAKLMKDEEVLREVKLVVQ